MPWQIDASHSEVTFSVRHMMLAKTRGRFEKFEGTIDADEANPVGAVVDVKIEAASLNSRDPQRDGHLKSPDFLNIEQYPYITFKSTKLVMKDAEHATLYGDLTIRDQTNEVALDVDYHGQSKSPWGTTAAGFSAVTKISRQDWGLTWNVALETGGVLVGDEITIGIEIELVKTEDAPADSEAVAA